MTNASLFIAAAWLLSASAWKGKMTPVTLFYTQKHKLPTDFADNQGSRGDDDNLQRSLSCLCRQLTPLRCAFQGKAYAFDSVFPTNATQEQIYNASAKQIVKGELGTHTQRHARKHARLHACQDRLSDIEGETANKPWVTLELPQTPPSVGLPFYEPRGQTFWIIWFSHETRGHQGGPQGAD